MITRKDVDYVASLARIHLRDEEAQNLTQDLEKILEYIEKLNALDVSGVDPTSHVLPLKNVHRQDTVRPSLSQSDALKISVESKEGSFKVPKIIEQ